MRTKERFILLAVATALRAVPAHAQSPSEAAHEVLKRMTDYVSGQDTVSFDYSADLEAVTKKGIKLQFSGSGQMLLDRPNKFRISRTGGFADIELLSDGETVTLYGRKEMFTPRTRHPSRWMPSSIKRVTSAGSNFPVPICSFPMFMRS